MYDHVLMADLGCGLGQDRFHLGFPWESEWAEYGRGYRRWQGERALDQAM